jgi:putative transposase
MVGSEDSTHPTEKIPRNLPVPEYRRCYVPGGSFFFTVVTAARRPILTTELGRKSLHEAIAEVRAEKPFDLFAIVLLPDHFHCVWNLPPAMTISPRDGPM